MRVVVTGGAGFIGANLCRRLVTTGVDDVVAFDNLATGRRENLEGTGARLVEGTILDAKALDAVLDATDAVVHLAARPSVPKSIADPAASHAANVTGTTEVLEAIRRAGGAHLIVASSSSVYGSNPTLPKHEDLRPQPVSPYAATKLATEVYSLAWARSFGLDVLVFRFFNVFGPLQPAGHAYAAVVPAFVAAALSHEPIPIHGDGLQTRDFTFVDSVAEVIADAVRRRVTCEDPVNLAFGGRHSLLAILEMLEATLGRPLERVHLDPRPGDVRDSQADTTRLQALFPDVRPVAVRDGLRRTVEWFQTEAARR
jgi:UDP-glucose 4-epimerase